MSQPAPAWPRKLIAVILALCALCLSTHPAAHAQTLTLDRGHVDVFNVSAKDGVLKLDLKEDVTGHHIAHAPEEVVLGVNDAAWNESPANVPEIGAAGYLLPQTQDAELLWPGWDTQGVRDGGFGAVDLQFIEVSGPGEVFTFQEQLGSVHPVLEAGEYQLRSGSTIHQATPSHVHVNWLFTQPGTYTMKVRAEANGVQSNTATYTWHVGDRAPRSNSHDGHNTPRKEEASLRSAQRTRNTGDGVKSGNSGSNVAPGNQTQSSATGQNGQQCSPGLLPRIKDDRAVPAAWKDPAGMTFGLGNSAKTQLPRNIGPVAAGDAWMIGATQQAGVPWLGANTQHPSLIENTTGEVTWELVGVDGPGPMVVFTQGGLGQIVGEEWFHASGGKVQGSHTIRANSHVHPSWVFGKAGTYHVTVKQTAKRKDGKPVSGTATLTFVVGGQGNANDGHFDFGSIYDPHGSCGGTGGASTEGAAAAGDGGSEGGSLADTGVTLMTIPFAVLGLGVLVFGAGMVRLVRRLALL